MGGPPPMVAQDVEPTAGGMLWGSTIYYCNQGKITTGISGGCFVEGQSVHVQAQGLQGDVQLHEVVDVVFKHKGSKPPNRHFASLWGIHFSMLEPFIANDSDRILKGLFRCSEQDERFFDGGASLPPVDDQNLPQGFQGPFVAPQNLGIERK